MATTLKILQIFLQLRILCPKVSKLYIYLSFYKSVSIFLYILSIYLFIYDNLSIFLQISIYLVLYFYLYIYLENVIILFEGLCIKDCVLKTNYNFIIFIYLVIVNSVSRSENNQSIFLSIS